MESDEDTNIREEIKEGGETEREEGKEGEGREGGVEEETTRRGKKQRPEEIRPGFFCFQVKGQQHLLL